MVTVTSYAERQNKKGEKFYSLILSGDLEMVMSEESGRYYATAKTASITSTFDEATCQKMVGKKLPGRIAKVAADPYDYTVRETGEVIQLKHRWVYDPKEGSVEEHIYEKEIIAAADPFAF